MDSCNFSMDNATIITTRQRSASAVEYVNNANCFTRIDRRERSKSMVQTARACPRKDRMEDSQLEGIFKKEQISLSNVIKNSYSKKVSN
ncbi:hypothetical protein ABK040_000236 [Willaertia magna]